jgi:hypothetical protein
LVLRAVDIRITVFWDVTLWSFVFRYQRFGEICCLLLQGVNRLEVVDSPEMVITLYEITLRLTSYILLIILLKRE